MSVGQIVPVATEDGVFRVLAEVELTPIKWQLLQSVDDAGIIVYQISLRSNRRPAFESTMTRPVGEMTDFLAETLGGTLAEDRAKRYGEKWDSIQIARHALEGYKVLRAEMRKRGIAG